MPTGIGSGIRKTVDLIRVWKKDNEISLWKEEEIDLKKKPQHCLKSLTNDKKSNKNEANAKNISLFSGFSLMSPQAVQGGRQN